MKHLFYTAVIILSSGFGNHFLAQTTILEENFDAGIPSNYVLYNQDGYTPDSAVIEYTNAWISKQDPADPSNTVASSTSYFDQPGMANRWLVTPSITLGPFGNILTWQGKSHDASFAESYLVLLSTTGDAVADFTDTLKAVVNEDIYWTNHSVNLSELGYNGQNVHIAFVLRTLDGFKFYMDSLKVVEQDPVGVAGKEMVEFQLYPNPATETITFTTEANVQQAIIRDINGAIVMRSTEQEIDVRNLANGMYFLELVHSNGTVSKRFIKQ